MFRDGKVPGAAKVLRQRHHNVVLALHPGRIQRLPVNWVDLDLGIKLAGRSWHQRTRWFPRRSIVSADEQRHRRRGAARSTAYGPVLWKQNVDVPVAIRRKSGFPLIAGEVTNPLLRAEVRRSQGHL